MSIRKGLFLVFVLLVPLTRAGLCPAQEPTAAEMRDVLSGRPEFTEEDLSGFGAGEMIAKLLSPKNKREVAVLGVIRIDAPLETVYRAFIDTIGEQRKKTAPAYGKFSTPPAAGDLRRLRLGDNDIEALKNCRVGSCQIRLSAPMIKRLRREAGRAGDDFKIRASDLYRQMLLEYVREYLERGDRALIEYRNRPRPVLPVEDQRELLAGLFWIREAAPEFVEYLTDFPRLRHPEMSSSVSWAEIKFGLRPAYVITHTATYRKREPEISQILILSKQIYASRYIDSSLGLTALISFRPEGKAPAAGKTYLIFTNHTRASALGSGFGSFVRKIVEAEAAEQLETVLGETDRRARAAVLRERRQSEESAAAGERDAFGWLSRPGYPILIALAVILAAAVLAGYARYRAGG